MADSSVETPDPAARAPSQPKLLELLSAFTQVSLVAFGGALPWSRRMIVERKRWMTNDEFNETFALSQFLPGPNTINFSVVFGSRFGGAPGAAMALLGLVGPPLVVVLILGVLYERYGDIDTLGHILAGIASAAAGLLVASVGKMAAPMFMRKWNSGPPIAILAFFGVAIMHWPLPYVFLGLAPVSVLFAWFKR
jgi:chromate transporter